nr:NAD-dependent epimerase/dehydratase family protein [Vibrio agarivorans]
MKIVIIGGGWLGLPLGHFLHTNGHDVLVTKTSKKGCDDLAKGGLHTLHLELGTSLSTQSENHLRDFQPDVIVGCFPPGLRSDTPSRYVENWRQVSELAVMHDVGKIIMVSTSGVYPSIAEDMVETRQIGGKNLDEKTQLLLSAEQQVIKSQVPYTILRCSGLIGPNRHPARFAKRLKSISDQAPANMVHLDDVIAVIEFVLTSGDNEIYNVTTPETVSKYQFYQRATKHYHEPIALPAPSHTQDKRIVATKLIAAGFKFKYSHIFNALDAIGTM